jgi:hypothetical protein
MDKEPHRASRKSNLKIESKNTPEPPYGGAEARAAFGSHRLARPRLSSAAGTIGGQRRQPRHRRRRAAETKK